MVLVVFMTGCEMKPVSVRPVLVTEGEVYLYLMPFPEEAERVNFSLDGVSVIDDEGKEFPLSLSFSRIRLAEMQRQRLLASGRLPGGMYKGILFHLKGANPAAANDEGAPSMPEETVMTDFSFLVTQKQAQVIWLTFRYDKSFPTQSVFIPTFDAAIPERQPSGVTGYVVNSGSNIVTVFDKQRKEVTGAIATGLTPMGAALDPRLGRLYISLAGEARIQVFDVQSWNEIAMIDLARGDNLADLTITPDGRTLISANADSNTVSLVDTSSLIETATIPVGEGPISLLMDPSGRRVFVVNSLSNTLSVVDIGSAKVAATIAVESRPIKAQFNRNGDRLYIVHQGSPYVIILDPRSLTTIGRYYIGMGISAFKIDTQTDLLYTGNVFEPQVTVYDPVSFVSIDSIETEGPVTYMTINGEENELYLVIPSKKMVAMASLVRKRTISAIDTGEGPSRVTFNGER